MPELTFTQFLILAVIIAIVWQILESAWKHWRTRRLGVGFQRYARDPDFRRMMMEDLERQLEADEELKRDPDKIRKLLDQVLEGKNVETTPGAYWGHSLISVGIVARSPLLEAIEDPRFIRNAQLTGQKAMGVELIIDMIGDLRIAEAVPRLLQVLDSTSDAKIRRSAIIALTEIGTDECIPACLESLTSNDEHVIELVLSRLAFKEDSVSSSPGFRSAMFDGLIALFMKDWELKSREYAAALINLNEARASELFCSPESLRSDHPNIRSIAYGVAGIKAVAEKPRLLSLLNEYEHRAFAGSWPEKEIYPSLLRAYGRAAPQEALLLIAKGLNEESCKIKNKLSDVGVMILDTVGPADLGISPPLSNEDDGLLHEFEAEVMNGGLLQYFANPGDKDAAKVLAIFEKHNCTKAARILRDTMALFGKGGPEKDSGKRTLQLSKLSDKKIERMESLSQEYYGLESSGEDPRMLMTHAVLNKYMDNS